MVYVSCCRDKLTPLVALGFHCRELDAFVTACRAPACRRSVLLTALACGINGAASDQPVSAVLSRNPATALSMVKRLLGFTKCQNPGWFGNHAEQRQLEPSAASALSPGCQSAELLDVYRAAVLAAQQSLRRTAAPSLTALRCFLAEFLVRPW